MTASMPHLLIAGYVPDWLSNPDVQRGFGVAVSFSIFTERVRTRTTGTLHGASPHQGPSYGSSGVTVAGHGHSLMAATRTVAS